MNSQLPQAPPVKIVKVEGPSMDEVKDKMMVRITADQTQLNNELLKLDDYQQQLNSHLIGIELVHDKQSKQTEIHTENINNLDYVLSQ